MRHAPRPNGYRDAWCGQLTADRADTEARVAGWVHRRRDHGGLIFIDVRDRSGIVQLVFHPENAPAAHQEAHKLRSEDVISARGTVTRRDPQNVNPNLDTGEIELAVSELEILADADTPPFPLDEAANVDEILRLRHRSLDLRTAQLQRTLALRHRAVATMREVLNERDFLEIETPYLTRSTPEGARDYLVPSRIYPGTFYALPQSPQILKQLLMMGGLGRYMQIARCFRDEDPRADRQPEFTQIDVEMSFVSEADVMAMMEGCIRDVWFRALDHTIGEIPQLTFHEAIRRFGSDKPDLRFGLELVDVAELFHGSDFKLFHTLSETPGNRVIALRYPGGASLSRRDFDALTETAKSFGAKGLAYITLADDGAKGPIVKF
ncbi:MAG TPA: aspartate--tRNA ligase, partial [Solirubrobacteraceae bacterium]